jgi:hypothetical protein
MLRHRERRRHEQIAGDVGFIVGSGTLRGEWLNDMRTAAPRDLYERPQPEFVAPLDVRVQLVRPTSCCGWRAGISALEQRRPQRPNRFDRHRASNLGRPRGTQPMGLARASHPRPQLVVWMSLPGGPRVQQSLRANLAGPGGVGGKPGPARALSVAHIGEASYLLPDRS